MVYVTLTRKEIELLADCRHITLRDATGERQFDTDHPVDTDHPAWNGLVGAACDSAYLLDVIRAQKAEVERLIREVELRKEEVFCIRNSQTLELANAKLEVERLTRDRAELIETTAAALYSVGEPFLGDRFRASKSPLHQRLSMVFHALAAKRAAGGE